MLKQAKPTSKRVPLIITPEMRLIARYQFWERIEYFALGLSTALLIVVFATSSWPKLGFPVFTIAVAILASHFKKHISLSAEEVYKIQAEEVEINRPIHTEGRN